MKTKTLVIIVSIQVAVLLVLSGFLIYPYLPKKETEVEHFGVGEGNPIVVPFDEYSEKIAEYSGKHENVGPVPDEETAKAKALQLWEETLHGVTLVESTMSVNYYEEQECWVVSVMDDSQKVETIGEMVQVTCAKTFYSLITKDGEVLAVYER